MFKELKIITSGEDRGLFFTINLSRQSDLFISVYTSLILK